jgi:hypothetical protein
MGRLEFYVARAADFEISLDAGLPLMEIPANQDDR